MKKLSRRSMVKTGVAAVLTTGLSSAVIAAEGSTTNEAPKTGEKEQEYDVVIIGSGCAGLAAAIEAKKAGANPIILEKMSAPAGNTIFSGGIINAADTYVQKQQGVKDSKEDLYNDMMKVSLGRGDPKLTRMYVDKIGDQIQWLTDVVGVKFRPLETEVWPMLQRGHVVDGPLNPHGAQLSQQMLDTVKKMGIPVMFNTKVIEITSDPILQATGVKAIVKDKEPITIKAKGGVVVATGGFHANKEMVTRYMGGDTAWMPIRGSNNLTGENVTLTSKFNPMYVNMDQFHGGPIHGPTKANPSIMVNYGVLTKKDGTRFMDEVETYVRVAKSMPKLIPDNKAFIIIDDQVTGISTIQDRIKRYKRANAEFFTADSIPELAKKAGIPEETLVKVIDEYNKAVKEGKASELVPPNTLEKPRLIEKPPFYAFPFMGGMTATFGGPKINTKAQILNTEGKPIHGLYGAGNAVGGLLYDDYIGGSQLGAALIWGRTAGAEAAARAKAKAN